MSAWNVLVVTVVGGSLLAVAGLALVSVARGVRQRRVLFRNINAHVRGVLAQFEHESYDVPQLADDIAHGCCPASSLGSRVKIVLTLPNGKRLR